MPNSVKALKRDMIRKFQQGIERAIDQFHPADDIEIYAYGLKVIVINKRQVIY